MNFRIQPLALCALAAGLLACGGDAADQAAAGDTTAVPATSPAVRPEPQDTTPQGPVDPQQAARGHDLFTSKACIGCHTIGGGRLTGPDLAGVTERRTREWILAMITKPDSMLRNDATARQLFMEYATPMVNMGVTEDEARALYAYLRSAGAGQ